MTPDQFRAAVKALGLQPCRPSFDNKTLHVDRHDQFRQVPDPEYLTPEEREATIELLRAWYELGDH